MVFLIVTNSRDFFINKVQKIGVTFEPSFFLRTYLTKDKQIQLKRLFFFFPNLDIIGLGVIFNCVSLQSVETKQKAQRGCLGNLHLEWSIQRSRDIFEA